MKYGYKMILWAQLLGIALPAFGQSEFVDRLPRGAMYRRVITYGRDSLNCYLGYPSGSSEVLAGYGSNPAELRKLNTFIHRSFSNPQIFVRSVCLTGYCSIEGLYVVNDNLSTRRAVKLKEYLNDHYNLSARCSMRVNNVAEDWKTLRCLVDVSPYAWRAQALAIIDSTEIFNGREKKLMDLQGGIPYREMKRAFFPMLRRVELILEYDLRKIIEVRYNRMMTDLEFVHSLRRERYIVVELNRIEMEQQLQQRLGGTGGRLLNSEEIRLEAIRRAEVAIREDEKREMVLEERLIPSEKNVCEVVNSERQEVQQSLASERVVRDASVRRPRNFFHPHIGIKTNLVAWAGVTPQLDYETFMPNLAVEVFFAKRWSAELSGTYADFGTDGGKYWGVSGYSVEPRFWVRRDGTFRGFYFGVYGLLGDFNRRDDASNYTGTYWQGGLSAGYYLLLGRHWGFELGVRGGYQQADVIPYDIENGHYYRNKKTMEEDDRLGLTRINASMSYRF